MSLLGKKLVHYTLPIAKELELQDSQYQSLKTLYVSIKHKEFYLSLIISNALISYQLSGPGEGYWEEFSLYFQENIPQYTDEIIPKIHTFIMQSKGNKRLINMKYKRLKKFESFLKIFEKKIEFYYNNIEIFCHDLSKHMNQKITDKTIVFTAKMFYYGAKNYFKYDIIFPMNISIPIDSRLTKIYKKYNENPNESLETFFQKLSEEIQIPPIHLDVILWNQTDFFLANEK